MQKEAYSPVAFVTGASSGVGYALTAQLLEQGFHVATLSRSELPDLHPAVRRARAEGRLRSYRADLSDVTSAARVLEGIAAQEPRIDLLVNNAAVSLGEPVAAPSGRDVHFEVNTLAPYLVIHALTPSVAASERKMIVNVSSNALLGVKSLDLQELMHPTRFERLFGSYAASKLALSLWTLDLAASLPEGVEIRSVCPGPNDTPMARGAGMPGWLKVFVPLTFRDPRRGAERVLDAARPGVPPGAFLNKGKVTALPLVHRAREVCEVVAGLVPV